MAATPNYAALFVKCLWMVVLMVVSIYVTVCNWDELDFDHLMEFKLLMFILNFLIYYSNLYQLVCSIGVFLDSEDDSEDVDPDQDFEAGTVNWGVASMALLFIFVWPVFMFKALRHKKLVSFVMLLDYLQALLIIPLSFVAVFSADYTFTEVDVLVNATATHIFNNLDDLFVEALFSYDGVYKLKKLYFNLDSSLERSPSKSSNFLQPTRTTSFSSSSSSHTRNI